MKKQSFLCLSLILFYSCTQEKIHNIVVIGGGLMGSSTAWQLSAEGEEVLVLEMQDSVYTYGSSQGEARIARSSNRGNDIWSYLHNRSVEEVQELIAYLESEEPETYHIDEIYTTTPVSYVGQMRIYDKLYASLIRQKVNYQMATNPQEGKELFGANLPEGILLQREYNTHSGTINPWRLIQLLHVAIRKKGNTVLYRHKVLNIQKKDDLYVISVRDLGTGDVKEIKTQKVVSAAGPYTGTLLAEMAPYFSQLINPQRVFLAFFKIDPTHFEGLSDTETYNVFQAYPVINSSAGTRDGSFFSMIEKVDKQGHPLIKIGGHFQRSKIEDLNKVWQKELTEEEIAWGRANTLKYFSQINVPLTNDQLHYEEGYSCVYSLTSTEVPYVSLLPDSNMEADPNFLVLAGMSGVGAKGAMAYGQLGANLLLGKSEEGEMYQAVETALGFDRLVGDIEVLDSEKK